MQAEGEQLRKEMKDPKREFVEAMVARLEGSSRKVPPKPKKNRSVAQKTTSKAIKAKPITSMAVGQSASR